MIPLSYIYLSIIIVLRDIKERGRELDKVLNQYIDIVKPAFEEFTLPVSYHQSITWVIMCPYTRPRSMQM